MEYRDERDALRGRVDNLEQELASANEELAARLGDDKHARIDRIEKQLGETKRTLALLEQELAALRGRRPNRWPRIVAGLGAMVVGSVAGMYLMARSMPAPVIAISEPRAHAPIEQADTPSPRPAPPPAARKRHAFATWNAKVVRAQGEAPAVGSACAIMAELESDGHAIAAAELQVTCGDRAIYRSTDALEGMSMRGSHAEEPGAADGHRYTLAYDDKGARSGARNEVSLDTSAKLASVWRDSVPSFRVDLAVNALSEPARGDDLLDGTNAR